MKKIFLLTFALFLSVGVFAQGKQLTREQILAMSTDELSELPLEDLMQAVETLGVSSVDELFALIMNKSVSSASKNEESSFSSPLSSTVITRDELRTYGISTIEEAFRLIPGMIVSEKTNGVYDVQMRGLNNVPDNNMLLYTENANTLLMIDGRPAFASSMGAINFDVLHIGIEDINRIEVVRGACSALYGANAVQGIINIITENSLNSKSVVSGDVQFGNQGTTIANVALRKKVNDKFGFGITANVQYRERPTDKIFLIPSSNLYLSTDEKVVPNPRRTVSKQEVGALMQQGYLLDVSKGGYYTVDEIDRIKQLYPSSDSTYQILGASERESPSAQMFENPGLARHSEGYNAYLNFAPTPDIAINLSAGFQRSMVNTTPVGDDVYSFNGRQSKTWYTTLNADIKGLKLQANICQGPQNFAIGAPGFKVATTTFNASAEYDIHLGDLLIRPGLAYMYTYYEDYSPVYNNQDNPAADNYAWHYEDPGYRYDESKSHLYGFFNYDATMSSIAPSLRLDYKLGDLRLIGAIRSDKTNIPDKWNPSWQIAANYSINEENFIRVVYGRANRGPIMVNTNMNYIWIRTEAMLPTKISFQKDKEADLVKIDNVELGYRWRPVQNLLLDVEGFFSKSQNFGALMAKGAYISFDKNLIESTTANYQTRYKEIISQYMSGELTNPVPAITQNILEFFFGMKDGSITNVDIQYGSLPYKVYQTGLSLNLDWIVSSKLIAKLNANVQRTWIDDYYQYVQNDVASALLNYVSTKMTDMLNKDVLGAEDKVAAVDQFIANEPNFYNEKTKEYEISSANISEEDVYASLKSLLEPALSDGHKHEATPSFYGMLGLVYKPLPQLNVSAFANYIGKRTYCTKYNTKGDELDPRLTVNLKVGYKPSNQVEVFFNAHNLFNDKSREFVYSDKIGGIYSVGVNFDF